MHLQKHKVEGFTLVELVITLLIGAILLGLAVPNYLNFKVRKEVSMNVNEIVYSFNLARAEAIRYGADVVVRAIDGNWVQGWQIWTLNPDGSDNIQLYDQQPLNQLSISQDGGIDGLMTFNRIGGLQNGGIVEFETDNAVTPAPNSQRNIQVLPSGSVRVVVP